MNNTTTTNGNGQELSTLSKLPAHRQSAWETQMLDYQHREHERETLRAELEAAQVEIRALEAELELFKSGIAQVESRSAACLAERDAAVKALENRDTLLASIALLLRHLQPDVAEA